MNADRKRGVPFLTSMEQIGEEETEEDLIG